MAGRRKGAHLIREVYPDRLYLGNAMDIRDLRRLYDNRIAAIVDLAINEHPAQPARDMIYCRIPIIDGDGTAIPIIEMAVGCVVMLMENSVRTIVACSAGMSRSPAIVAAAIAIATRTSPDDCLTAIASDGPHDVSPILWSHITAVYNRITKD
jgi:protein-tyrosine phosphatase